MKGAKPIPTHLKVVRGTAEKRYMNPNEPTPDLSDMEPPQELSPDARAEWDRVRKLLLDAGIVSVLDTAALVAYCETYATWADATQKVRKTGAVLKKGNGDLYRNPFLRVANDAQDRMIKLMAEFGMTPSSRTRVSARKDKPKDDPWSEFRA